MDQTLHMDPSPHTDQIPHVDQIPHMYPNPRMNIIMLTLLFRREGSYAYSNPSSVKQSALASMPPFSYGARRMMNSLPPLQMWVVTKRTNLLCRARSPHELKRLKNLLET